MKRTRTYRRFQRNRIINKKVSFLRQYGGEGYIFAWSRGNTGRLSKNKIHCSCWMCRNKSYDDFSHADKRKLITAQQQLREETSLSFNIEVKSVKYANYTQQN